MRRARVLLLALLGAVLLAGCTPLENASYDVEDLLAAKGFEEPYVDYFDPGGGNGAVLYVDYSSGADDVEEAEAEAEAIARTIWENAELRLSKVDVDATYYGYQDVPPTFSYTDERMRSMFGPRDPALDRIVADELTDETMGAIAVGVLVGVVVLAALAVVVTLWVVRNGRKRRAERAAYYWAHPPPAWGTVPAGPPVPYDAPPGAPPRYPPVQQADPNDPWRVPPTW